MRQNYDHAAPIPYGSEHYTGWVSGGAFPYSLGAVRKGTRHFFPLNVSKPYASWWGGRAFSFVSASGVGFV